MAYPLFPNGATPPPPPQASPRRPNRGLLPPSIMTAAVLLLSAATAPAMAQSLSSAAESWSLSFTEIVHTGRYISPEDAEIIPNADIARVESYAPDTLRRTFGYDPERGAYVTTEVLNPYNEHEDWRRVPVVRREMTRGGTRLVRADGSERWAQSPLGDDGAIFARLEAVAEGRGTFGYAKAPDLYELGEETGGGTYQSRGGGVVRRGALQLAAQPEEGRIVTTTFTGPDSDVRVAEVVSQFADAADVFGVPGAVVKLRTVTTTADTLGSGIVVTQIRTRERGDYRYTRGARVSLGVGGTVGVYPNPVSARELTVALPIGTHLPLTLEVVDPLGRVLVRRGLLEDSPLTQLLRLPEGRVSGMYILRAVSDHAEVATPFLVTD